ncbi:MAG: hypothetical protein AAF404_10280 [Pseudomonadota bacterium]
MSDLSHRYRAAPRLRSPASVDEHVLQEAQRRAQANSPQRHRWIWSSALATAAVVVLGVTLLMRHGIPPLSPQLELESESVSASSYQTSSNAEPAAFVEDVMPALQDQPMPTAIDADQSATDSAELALSTA